MRPRAESRVCKMEFNWLSNWARSWAFSASACAAAWRAFPVSASAARCWAMAAERSLAAWSAAACAACCWSKAAALAFSASACWRAAAALSFSYGIGAGLGFAFFGGFLVPGDFCVGVFFGFLLHGHDAGFFGGLHDFAGGGDDGFLVALARVDFFGVAELQFGLGKSGSGVFVGERDVRDANGVARFKEFERGLAVDAKDGVFDFGVGRGVDAAAKKLVAGVDVFDFAERGGTEYVFEHDGVTGLSDGKVRFGGDDHAEGLHVGDGFDFAGAILQHNFAEIYGSASRGDGPENVGEIFEAELGGFIEAEEFRINLGAAPLVLDSGFAAGLLHQFGALKIDLGGAGAAVVDGFGGPRNSFGRAGGRRERRRLTKSGSGQHSQNSNCHKIS